LGPTDKVVADHVLATWVGSAEAKRQFDALVLIDELAVVSALPSLRALAARLESSSEPSAPYDWAWINRIIGKLAAEISP
jgi:hypothetical protein